MINVNLKYFKICEMRGEKIETQRPSYLAMVLKHFSLKGNLFVVRPSTANK